MATAPAGQGVPVVLYLPGARRVLGMATAPAGQGGPAVEVRPSRAKVNSRLCHRPIQYKQVAHLYPNTYKIIYGNQSPLKR
jgi:hypothetical protein